MLLIVFISLILILIVVPSSSYQSIFSSINLYKHSISSTSLYSTIDAVSEFGLTPTLNKYVTGTD